MRERGKEAHLATEASTISPGLRRLAGGGCCASLGADFLEVRESCRRSVSGLNASMRAFTTCMGTRHIVRPLGCVRLWIQGPRGFCGVTCMRGFPSQEWGRGGGGRGMRESCKRRVAGLNASLRALTTCMEWNTSFDRLEAGPEE